MALRQRDRQVILISDETTFGDASKAVTMASDGTMSFEAGKNMVDLPRKRFQLTDTTRRNVIGRKTPSLTISSPLYIDFIDLLESYLDVDEDTLTSELDDSFCIRQLTPTGAAAGSGIEAPGCKPNNITLSQTDGIWMISLQSNAKSIELEKAVTALTGFDLTTDIPLDDTPERFDASGTCTITPYDGVGGILGTPITIMLEDLNISLNYERAEDQKRFRNSQTVVDDLICRATGEATITHTWDDADPFEGRFFTEGLKFRFLYDQGVNGLEIDFDFQMTNIDKPDDTQCVYSGVITAQIVDKFKIVEGTA